MKIDFLNSFDLQPANSFTMLELSHFHDRVNLILIFIISSVSSVILSIIHNRLIFLTVTGNHFLERVWIFIPCFIPFEIQELLKNLLGPLIFVLGSFVIFKVFSHFLIIAMSGRKSSPTPMPGPLLETKIAKVRKLLSKGFYWKAKRVAGELGVLDHFAWPR